MGPGAKSYALTHVTATGEEREILRCKGINLSSVAGKIITPSLIREVAQDQSVTASVPQHRFKRDPFGTGAPLRSVMNMKRFGYTDTKRVRLPEYGTLPLGF